MIVITRKHSYFIKDKDVPMIEVGSTVFDPANDKFYTVLTPGVLIENSVEDTVLVETLEALTAAIAAGGNINVASNINAPTGFEITTDNIIVNNSKISIPEDTEGNGVFKVTNGTLTLEGKGIINGVGKNDWSMAIWATDNGKVIINSGYFINVGATAEVDSDHFDLIYVSGNGQVEINGGEFQCETPKWTLNVKDKDRATASIVVKGGKFYGFNPADCETEGKHTNFVAPGYKVVEESTGVFVVMPE